MGNGEGAHASKHPVGNDERIMGFSVGEQDGKFVPFVPSCQICRAVERRLQEFGYLPEAGITGRTTVAIIEVFETINIAEQERERVSCFLRIKPSSFELPVKMTPIGDAC
jgi:hypothetical protein